MAMLGTRHQFSPVKFDWNSVDSVMMPKDTLLNMNNRHYTENN